MQNDYTPVVIVCNNCFHQLEAWKTPDGMIKKKCPYCGCETDLPVCPNCKAAQPQEEPAERLVEKRRNKHGF